VVSKRFSELQEAFFATTKRLRLAQGAEEKLALLNELQPIVEESRRALSETDPKESKRVPTLECPTAQALFESYSVAATEYFDAARKLANLVGSHDEFAAAQQHAKQTGGKCRAERLALEKHRQEHGCKIAI
jgi:hypothetical protein